MYIYFIMITVELILHYTGAHLFNWDEVNIAQFIAKKTKYC